MARTKIEKAVLELVEFVVRRTLPDRKYCQMEMVSQSGSDENFDGVNRLKEGKIRSHADQVVRETVKQTLNGLLEADADELCGAITNKPVVEYSAPNGSNLPG